MHLLVFGSLAYDRIMHFEGRFADHLLPDKIDVLNVCFTVSGLTEMLGGTAGNIAYGLAELGERPIVLSTLGRDGGRYLGYMQDKGIDTSCVRVIEEEYTAGAFITGDKDDNQITNFNPGAMNHSCRFDLEDRNPADCLAVIAPGNLEDMQELPRLFRERRVPYIFDPGQQLNIIDPKALEEAITGAYILISSDYELEMITNMTGLDTPALKQRARNIITTKGEKGSVLLTDQGSVDIPAAPADEVQDPTGAGDAYRSGLMKGLALGESLAEACLYGAAISSFAVSLPGTQEYRLRAGQFEERLAKARKLMA